METGPSTNVLSPGSKAVPASPADPSPAPAHSSMASSKSSPLRWVTAGTPTNWNMLLFRTLNREMGQPNANADDLAPLLRDRLMPLRMWWLRRVPGAMKGFRHGLEHRKHGVPGVVNFVDARTSWFDSVVKEALGRHAISQVVVVAAGFDTRAYRIGSKHKGVTFFEVDLPHASKKKQQLVHELLQPEASFPRPTFLAADLATLPLDSVLLGASANTHSTTTVTNTTTATNTNTTTANTSSSSSSGGSSGGSSKFDPSLPTLFTVEGLIYYLPEAAVRGLFAAIVRIAAPGSRVAFDFLHKEVLDGSVPLPPAYKVTATSVANKGEPFISGITSSREAVQSFLSSIPTPTSSAAPPTAAAAAAGESVPVAPAPSSSSGDGREGVRHGWRLVDFMGPREAVSRFLPHLTWDDALPPILSFYSYASAQLVAAE